MIGTSASSAPARSRASTPSENISVQIRSPRRSDEPAQGRVRHGADPGLEGRAVADPVGDQLARSAPTSSSTGAIGAWGQRLVGLDQHVDQVDGRARRRRTSRAGARLTCATTRPPRARAASMAAGSTLTSVPSETFPSRGRRGVDDDHVRRRHRREQRRHQREPRRHVAQPWAPPHPRPHERASRAPRRRGPAGRAGRSAPRGGTTGARRPRSPRVCHGVAWLPLTTTRGSSGSLRRCSTRFTRPSQHESRPSRRPMRCGPAASSRLRRRECTGPFRSDPRPRREVPAQPGDGGGQRLPVRRARGGVGRGHLGPGAGRRWTAVAEALRAAGVRVHVFDDEDHTRPDSVFPNNWISTHAGGTVAVFPMYASNRRHERRADVLEMLKSQYRVQTIIDYSGLEPDGIFLEGTGAMVLDHVSRVAYTAVSHRADTHVLERFCTDFNYEPMAFDAVDSEGVPVYHTNVMGVRRHRRRADGARDDPRRAAPRAGPRAAHRQRPHGRRADRGAGPRVRGQRRRALRSYAGGEASLHHGDVGPRPS